MSYRQLTFAVSLLLALTSTISAQDLSTAPPEAVGLSPQGLERATEQLTQHVSNGDVAGVVAAVVRDPRALWQIS